MSLRAETIEAADPYRLGSWSAGRQPQGCQVGVMGSSPSYTHWGETGLPTEEGCGIQVVGEEEPLQEPSGAAGRSLGSQWLCLGRAHLCLMPAVLAEES